MIVEAKDEHDFDPTGRDFAKRLRLDLETMGTIHWTPAGKKAQFSMLRQEHCVRAQAIFGTDDFERLFA